MSTSTDLKTEIQKSLDQLRTIKDEIRVQLHLAGMEAKEEWNKLEPQLDEAEKKAHELTNATKHALADALHKVSALRAKLS